MKINNKQFYSYEEIKEVALNAIRDEIIRKCNETDRKYIIKTYRMKNSKLINADKLKFNLNKTNIKYLDTERVI